MAFNVYAFTLFCTAFIGLLLALFAWKLGKAPGVNFFALLSLAAAIYSLGYAFEISTTSLQEVLFWLRLQYLGISFIPAFLILFAIHYSGRSRWLSPPVMAAIYLIPVITLVLFYTNGSHQLIYQSVRMNTEGPFPVIYFEAGPWYWVHNFYMGFAVIFSNFLFLMMWLRSGQMYRRQVAVIMAGSLVPWGSFFINLVRQNNWSLDAVPFAFTFSGILFFWGLFRYQLFTLAPVARTTLFEKMTDGVLVIDWNNKIADSNGPARKYLGITNEAVGKSAENVLQLWPEILEKELTQKKQIELKRSINGILFWFELEFLPLSDHRGTTIGKMVVIREITERKKTEKDLQASEERYRVLVENANEAIVVNQDLRHKFVNPMALKLFECSEDKLTSVSFLEFVHPEDREMVKERYTKRIKGEIPREKYTLRIVTCSGVTKWVEVSAVLIEWKDKPATLSMISDITDRKKYEEQLTYLSLHDQLTGLYNRTYFEEELHRLGISREYPITIIAADVDGLKLINDTLGHEKGDELLKACAEVLKKSLRQSDILVRLGGDEFVIVLPRTDREKGKEIGERIRTNVALYNKNSTKLSLSISIGIETADNKKESLKEIYKKADDFMYRDKMLNKSSTRRKMMEALLAAQGERDNITQSHS